MVRLASIVVAACVGCAGPGAPRYHGTAPSALPASVSPRASSEVRLELAALPWWTGAGTPDRFILGFDDPRTTPTPGTRLGPVRSRDIVLAPPDLAAVRCAWMIVPMGDGRLCHDTTRAEAAQQVRGAIEQAHDDLRARTGAAGADVVGNVRCFAARDDARDARLWCEGVAIATTASRPDPHPSGAGELDVPTGAVVPSRFVLAADGSIGMLGGRAIVGASIGLRYRVGELAFYMLDLDRGSVLPQDGGVVGLGLTALGRLALGRSRADAIAGVSAVAVAINGSTNPDFDGLYHTFVGVAYQSPWRIGGAAQPFAQLRAGVARGSAIARLATTESQVVPMLELHVGLSTPERR
jgi:hypothetical protein